MNATMPVGAVLLGLLAWQAPGPTGSGGAQAEPRDESTNSADEQAAFERYISAYKVLIETKIVPGLKRGILSTATSRPRTLNVEVTDDPSPYHFSARADPDGSLAVHLPLGYLTLHDAALDAVGIAAALNRPRELRQYLVYQLRLAEINRGRRAQHQPTLRAKKFAEFAGLDPVVVQGLFAQRDWAEKRHQVQIQSLGWVVAYLLVQADPRLAGLPQPVTANRDAGAARLALASGWFPVTPFATAFGLSGIEAAKSTPQNAPALLCRAAQMMESGLAIANTNIQALTQIEREGSLEAELAGIREQIRRIRQESHCQSGVVAKRM